MPRGGKRVGAGRPRGSKTVKSRAEGNRLARKDRTPLRVMEHAMNLHFDAGEYDAAAAVAKDMAPYVHARLAAVEVTGKDGSPLFNLTHDRIRTANAERRRNGVPPELPG